MGEVLKFRPRAKAAERAKGKTLCGSGFHKWTLDRKRRFDVKKGKLLTVYRCTRCGVEKTRAE